MKRPFLAQLVCIVRGVVILLSAARPVRAGNNMEVQLCLMSTRMLLPTAAPRRWRGRYPLSLYNTNDNNPRNWVRLSGTRAFCKFTSPKDGSRIHVLPYTLHTKQPWQHVQESHAHLSSSQGTAVEQIVLGRDKMMGVEGVAGAGKTTSVSATREAVECEGYQVIGLAPTSRAAHKLAESGIEPGTLQRPSHSARSTH
jgi:AAA domain